MVVYYNLFDLLKRKGMKISDLRGVISSATVAKINKGQHISGECIDKICRYLKCQPNDIMEIVQSEEEEKKRQKGDEMIERLFEKQYEMIKTMAMKQKKPIAEFWEEYKEYEKPKKKETLEFKELDQYIQRRIAQEEQE